MWIWCGWLALALYCFPARVDAGNVGELASIRQELRDYGPQGRDGLRAMDVLDNYIKRTKHALYRSEARYLRVAILTDLYFVAAYRKDSQLQHELAKRLRVQPAEIEAAIRDDLALEQWGPLRSACARVLEVLHLAQGATTARPLDYGEVDSGGVAERLVALHRLATTIEAGQPLESLAEQLGKDPCSEPAQCGASMLAWPAQVRARLDGLAQVGRWLIEVKQAAASGDPLAHTLASSTSRWAETISQRVVPLVSKVSDDLEAPLLMPEQGVPIIPLQVVQLEPDGRVTFIRTPRAHLDSEGIIEILPEQHLTALALPKHVGLPRQQETLRTALSQVCQAAKHAQDTVVRARRKADLLSFTKLLYGLHLAGCSHIALMGSDGAREPKALYIEPVLSTEEPEKRFPVEVHVDPSNVRVNAYGITHTCTRESATEEHGSPPLYDWPRLRQVLNTRRQQQAVMTYTGWAPLAQLLGVAPLVAYKHSIRLALPFSTPKRTPADWVHRNSAGPAPAR